MTTGDLRTQKYVFFMGIPVKNARVAGDSSPVSKSIWYQETLNFPISEAIFCIDAEASDIARVI